MTKERIEYFRDYVKSYSHDVDEKTFILDMLYGIGISINREKYSWGEGFEKFMQEKIESLIKG